MFINDLGLLYKDFLPYWSKVENLTVHKKKDIDENSANSSERDPAKQPVSLIDIALSEIFGRKLFTLLNITPINERELRELLSFAGKSKTFNNSVDKAKKVNIVLISLFREKGFLTTDPDRDVKVIEAFSKIDENNIYNPKDPNSFSD